MFKIVNFCVRKYSSNILPPIMKYLSVAEKNDAAKTIAGHLSRGTANRREGLSVFNKIYEFPTTLRGQNCDMIMTSVSGHLLNYEFSSHFRGWKNCDPIQLFDAPITKNCPEDYQKIKQTLEKEIRGCSGLIIWTDCDREGENIGFEIIEVCKKIKPNIQILRAKFSEMTAVGIRRAMDNLVAPDERISQAVDVRQQLDLRIGAAFTRFQTLRLQAVFPAQIVQQLISYGSCQIPTLGFVVQRFREAENFIPQKFWKIKVTHIVEHVYVEFIWARKRLFDKQCCEAFFMVCTANQQALVKNVTEKSKSKWRPVPLDTVELEKLGSRKLKINAKETMTIAEKLYREGIISYPRTETNMFSKEINLRSLTEMHTSDAIWGGFASKVLEWGPNPRNGSKSDQAHPPIHPTKYVTNLHGKEKQIYELIVRHFLACISRDATGSETNVLIEIANEEFNASGLCIYERNYLEVYPYDKWNAKEIHNYKIGNTFIPSEMSMPESSTTTPQMLTEADLIALMEKHGIGTDATHAEHINTIKERGYIGEVDEKFLVPGEIGMGLVEGYDAMNLPLAQPKLRAELEKDLKLICEGKKNPDLVLADQINKYRDVYRVITQEAIQLDHSMGNRLNERPRDAPLPNVFPSNKELFKCSKCRRNSMTVRSKKDNSGFFIGCQGFPDCKNALWLSDVVKEINVLDVSCSKCGPNVKKVNVSFKQRSVLATLGSLEETYTSCLICDQTLRHVMNIDDEQLMTTTSLQPSNQMPPRVLQSVSSQPRNTLANRPVLDSRNIRSSENRDSTLQTRSQNRSDWSQPPPPIRDTLNLGSQNINRGNNQLGSQEQISNSGNTVRNNVGWFADNVSDNRRPHIPTPGRSNDSHSNINSNSDGGDVKCGTCGGQATKLTVRKESANKGREFYICKNTTTCNFFQWADDNHTTNTWGGERSTSNGRPSGSSNSSNNFGNRDISPDNNERNGDTRRNSKRKCGLCRQEGHTKNKCPRLSTLDHMS